MTTRALYICIILFFVASLNAVAQVAPKYSNEFLSIGVGARSFGMSGSVTASATGTDAIYYNPASLTGLTSKVNAGLMHSEYFAGLASYDFGALAFTIDDKSAFGISFIRFGVDNIPNTTELIDNNGNIRFDRIKPFSSTDNAFFISYARKLSIENLSIGGNVKIIRRKGGDFAEAWGFGIDISAKYIYNSWNFAVMARDVTTTFNSWSFNTENLEDIFTLTGNAIPDNTTEITLPKFIMAASYRYVIADKFGVLGEINADITTDGKRNVLIKRDIMSIDPHVGVEVDYKKFIFLRAGVGNIQTEYSVSGKKSTTLQPNMGIGVFYKKFTFDYALTDIGDVSAAGYSHVFSIGFSFDKLNIDKQP